MIKAPKVNILVVSNLETRVLSDPNGEGETSVRFDGKEAYQNTTGNNLELVGPKAPNLNAPITTNLETRDSTGSMGMVQLKMQLAMRRS